MPPELRPYQEDAADFLYSRDTALVLAPVGAGKTAITLTAMSEMLRDGHAKRWLVIAPKRVCESVWPAETALWAPRMKLALATGSPAVREAAFWDPTAHIVVTNYDVLQSLPDGPGFDGVVFDELTRLKNPSGKRFKALHKQIKNFRIRWGLTGSFTSNGLEDVFGQCKIVDETLLGRAKGAFLQQYFYCVNREFGEWSPVKGALEQVMARIKPATFVLEPGDYKDKLPPLHTIEMRCDMDRAPYEKMKKDFVLEYGDDTVIAANAAVVTQKLSQLAAGFVYNGDNRDPVWFGSHKFDLLADLLAENQHDNTLLVYNYQEELAEIKRRWPRVVTIDQPGAIDRWNAGEIELLAVHPKSGGHGLNLQYGGSKLVFISLPWSLELYEQVVGRLHRGGQKKDVWCYVLLTNKTVDERIWAALHDKRALSDVALEELKQ